MKYIDSYRLLFLRLGAIFSVYTLCRGCFYWFNQSDYQDISSSDILYGFLHGWRFDTSAILYVNLLFIVLSLLPFQFITKKKYQKFLKIFFICSNAFFILPNLIDIEYIQFTDKRTDIFVFTIMQDIGDQFSQLSFNYWYIALLFIGIIFILWKLYPDAYKHHRTLPLWKGFLFFLVLSGGCLVGMRGGLQKRPIQLLTAFSKGNEIGNLSLNTTFSVLMSLDKKGLDRKYFFTEQEIQQQLTTSNSVDSIEYVNQNIVILILESFAAEYTGFMNDYQGYTPFLDSLAKEGIYFNKVIANGSTSAQSAPSILLGLPAMMDMPIPFSIYQNNQFFSIFHYLRQHGYQSYFFHGGNNGTMGFDFFTQKLGFQYFGLNEYPQKRDHDGNWGIFDEPYLQYCAEYLEGKEQPFLSTIFTLSSHHPYTIPTNYQGKFPKGQHSIHESIGYSDYALMRFFDYAKTTDWYDNTLFIITADHTNQKIEKAYKNMMGNLKIPLLLYHPNGRLPQVDTSKLVQQTDIPASILDYLGHSPHQLPKFSHSIFNPDTPQEAIFYLQNNYYYIRPTYYIRYFNDQYVLYNWKDERLPETEILDEDRKQLKAYIQYFHNSMIDNNFIDE